MGRLLSSLRHLRSGGARRVRGGVRRRRGFTLMELLISIAIIALVTAVLAPSLSTMLMLDQRNAARKVALAFEKLRDEAVLRNKTFRVAFDLRNDTWQVEVGEPGATIFADPDDREAWEERLEHDLEDMSDYERRAWEKQQGFRKVGDADLGDGPFELPDGTRFVSVYTPQHEEPVRSEDVREERQRDEDDLSHMVYTYFFSNGFAEHCVVQIATAADDDEGFTIIVDPMSGRVTMRAEIIDAHDAFDFLPEEGPKLEL